MTTTPTAPTPPTGHVVSQVEVDGQNQAGQWVKGVNVTGVIDATGTTFTVFVPLAQYTPELVRQMLADRAAQVAAVHGLTFGG